LNRPESLFNKNYWRGLLVLLRGLGLLAREFIPWRTGGRNRERVISNYQLPIVMAEGLIAGLVVFTLASFVGFEVINKVPPTLHTPLMSGSNAISGIAVLGAILISGQGNVTVTSILGTIAIALATINVVGGFLVTDRMLQMFKKKEVKA
jgi:NAD(P) transhydrogenase subunit alpha